MAQLFPVRLYGKRVGTLHRQGDYTWFKFDDEYLEDPDRAVLGLRFEENLYRKIASHLRLPAWFSNLLPEGQLRTWIATDRGVSEDREMELLAHVGHDLPGAVTIGAPSDDPNSGSLVDPDDEGGLEYSDTGGAWKFSLAGVALKFSMQLEGDRLTLPATGEGGDWIVKLPDPRFKDVPRNEYTMMKLASWAGIEVPEIRLVHRDEIGDLPSVIWEAERWAFAIRRFDRRPDRSLVHIEDLAQVRGVYAADKYRGNYETVASLAFRGRDEDALREVVRRVVFAIAIGNGDLHLKNWSLIYHNARIPTLSPAYDFVCTVPYRGAEHGAETLALKLGGSRRMATVGLHTFDRLERLVGAFDIGLPDVAREVVRKTVDAWEDVSKEAPDEVRESLAESLPRASRLLS